MNETEQQADTKGATHRWPRGTHKVNSLASKPLNEAHHQWHIAERGRTDRGYLKVLWICPCGAHHWHTFSAPYSDGTPVPDPAWDVNGQEEA